MRKGNSVKSVDGFKIFFRSLAYSSIIGAILFILILLVKEEFTSSYLFLSSIGFIVILVESFFLVFYANANGRHKKLSRHSVVHHGINHIFYPILFYVGLAVSIYFGQDIIESTLLAFVGFVLLFLQFLVISQHVVYGHVDDEHHTRRSSVRVDFILYMFKFFSYFAVNLALFQALVQNRLGSGHVFFINLLINFLYLISHLNRKEQTRGLNLFMAFVFSLIISLFIIQSRLSIINYSATVATIIFYITSGIFFHKVEGTLTSRVLVEYGSVAVILSIFLFSA